MVDIVGDEAGVVVVVVVVVAAAVEGHDDEVGGNGLMDEENWHGMVGVGAT